MGPTIDPVETTAGELPHETTVVIIGAGIIGLTAALTLAERGIPVVVLEKGQLAGEQSSRNLGWIRKTSRKADDLPLAQAADRLWAEMSDRVGRDVGYRQSGIMFVARSADQMAAHEAWLSSVEQMHIDSRLLSAREIDDLVPGNRGKWAGGIYTPSDGRGEPTQACSAIARAAMAKGAVIMENCAVRTLSMAAGRVDGVHTERGAIRCSQVLLAGGMWSRRFLRNLGVSLPALPLISSVLRTRPMTGPTEIAVGAPSFSFRKHKDGGFIITQRGKLDAPLTLDHLCIGRQYMGSLRSQRDVLQIGFGKYFFEDLKLGRRWKADSVSPFEKWRTIDPTANETLNQQAMANLKAAWPAFENAAVEQTWAGMIDVTPDSNPIISRIEQIPGLTVATGFSGHGFGTSPAAGQLAADLVSNETPLINPEPYSFSRF